MATDNSVERTRVTDFSRDYCAQALCQVQGHTTNPACPAFQQCPGHTGADSDPIMTHLHNKEHAGTKAAADQALGQLRGARRNLGVGVSPALTPINQWALPASL